MPASFVPVIGLEVHVQLSTASKLFCRCSTAFGAPPNTQVCPVCIGLPGALPVLNRRALEFALRLGLAIGAQIDAHCQFDRKHYFYPDLPKGYQITQYKRPLCRGGLLEFETDGTVRAVRVRRAHLEEDAGRSVHAEAYVAHDETLVDLNRCGVPLVELVTEPELHSAQEAVSFVAELRRVVRALGICDGQMERGSLRCDANVSVRGAHGSAAGVPTELKNLNSLRSLQHALTAELRRQIHLRQQGKQVAHETLGWDPVQHQVIALREKEYAQDYRYFPEPDLPPVRISKRWLDRLRRELPELPLVRKRRLERLYALPSERAQVLIEDPGLADYFEEVAGLVGSPRLACNWVTGEVVRSAKELGVTMADFPVEASALAHLLMRVKEGLLSNYEARQLLRDSLSTGRPLEQLLAEQEPPPTTQEVAKAIAEVLAAHAELVARFRQGKTELLDFFLGQVLKRLGGKAPLHQVMAQLREQLAGQERSTVSGDSHQGSGQS